MKNARARSRFIGVLDFFLNHTLFFFHFFCFETGCFVVELTLFIYLFFYIVPSSELRAVLIQQQATLSKQDSELEVLRWWSQADRDDVCG